MNYLQLDLSFCDVIYPIPIGSQAHLYSFMLVLILGILWISIVIDVGSSMDETLKFFVGITNIFSHMGKLLIILIS